MALFIIGLARDIIGNAIYAMAAAAVSTVATKRAKCANVHSTRWLHRMNAEIGFYFSFATVCVLDRA